MTLLTVKQAAQYLADTSRTPQTPHPCTIKRWIHRVDAPLPAVRQGRGHSGKGGVWLIDSADLDVFVIPHAGRPRKPRGKVETKGE